MKWIENGEGGAAFRCSADKPNVFLIGDSIRKGYCKTVAGELEGKARVVRLYCQPTWHFARIVFDKNHGGIQ